MSIIKKLRENYRNGKLMGFLRYMELSYCFMLFNPPSHIPYIERFRTDLLDEISRIGGEKARIPKPKGILEGLAYNFGLGNEGVIERLKRNPRIYGFRETLME